MVSRILEALDLPPTLPILDHVVEAISELSVRQRKQLLELLERLEDDIKQAEDVQDLHECDLQRRTIAKYLRLT